MVPSASSKRRTALPFSLFPINIGFDGQQDWLPRKSARPALADYARHYGWVRPRRTLQTLFRPVPTLDDGSVSSGRRLDRASLVAPGGVRAPYSGGWHRTCKLRRMLTEMKKRWKEIRKLPPGDRFEMFYEKRRERDRGKPWLRVLYLGGALVAFAIGVVLAFIPGPAVVFFALSGALLATQSRKVARGLDWAEVKLRRVASRLRTAWRRMRGQRIGRRART
jgi:hypothetical protein